MTGGAQDGWREAMEAIALAERGVRVLRSIAWPAETKARFFADGGSELPRIEYQPFSGLEPTREARALAARLAPGDSPEERWLRRQAERIERAARMLAAVGTPDLFAHSRDLYGEPTRADTDGGRPALELAQVVDRLSRDVSDLDLGAPAPACHLATGVAEAMERAARERFGDAAPEVTVVETLSANALAGPRAIRIRRDACFTDKDVAQLVQHEAFVHVCTSLNGRAQADLPLLASAHPGTTRTQEGLAVFAEFVTGAMEPQRFRRLADRVLAIQMAIEGADFLDVYRYFLERTGSEDQAFENARRVFRGADLRGGAPFTKDVVYLDGLVRVVNFQRVAVAEGRADCLVLLFAGKLDLDDLPVLARFAAAGLLRRPRFLPPWMEDRRFLVSWLTLSRFLGQLDFPRVREHYAELLHDAPRLSPETWIA